eukprot:11735231-Ditylum_brightwellii.AAC.1
MKSWQKIDAMQLKWSGCKIKEEIEALNTILMACTKHLNNKVNDIVDEFVKYHHVKRKVIKSELATIQRKYVMTFCHSDDSSRIDTNTYRDTELNNDYLLRAQWGYLYAKNNQQRRSQKLDASCLGFRLKCIRPSPQLKFGGGNNMTMTQN